VRLLLDTNIIIRSAKGTLSKQALGILEDTSNQLYYSPISIWEIATKLQIGKLKPPLNAKNTRDGLDDMGCRELPVTTRHALAVGALSFVHKDPFDRMLVAQAFVEDMTLITTDSLLRQYAAEVMVVD